MGIFDLVTAYFIAEFWVFEWSGKYNWVEKVTTTFITLAGKIIKLGNRTADIVQTEFDADQKVVEITFYGTVFQI